MDCSLKMVVDAFADGLHAIDSGRLPHKAFQSGVGPYGEADAIRLALQHMRTKSPELFSEARTKRLPDVLIPGQWALEFKLCGHLAITGFRQNTGRKTFSIRTRATRARSAIA